MHYGKPFPMISRAYGMDMGWLETLSCVFHPLPNISYIDIIYIQPFTSHFPRADIHQLLAPDILHQIIKGTFKDHLVTWVIQYLEQMYGRNQANQILADIDRRLVSCTEE